MMGTRSIADSRQAVSGELVQRVGGVELSWWVAGGERMLTGRNHGTCP